MVAISDVDPRALNREVARELKERKISQPPVWAAFAKTGSHRERPPASPDWWHHRAAAVLRVVAVKGPIGTAKLVVRFGGRKNRGVKPDQYREAGGNNIRKCLQQLEKGGLIKQVERAGHKGRALTKAGAEFLNGAASRTRKAGAVKPHAHKEETVEVEAEVEA
jgi:small subunit ribosomal protein S19e